MIGTPVLKRRLNPFLLASTVLVLALLAGLSVVYQGQLEDVLQTQENLSSTLEEKNSRIDTLELRVSNLTNETSVLEQNVDKYVNRSENLKSEVSTLETEIDKLEDDKENLEDKISGLRSDKEDLRDTIDNINGTLELICDDVNSTVEDGDVRCDRWGHDFKGDEP